MLHVPNSKSMSVRLKQAIQLKIDNGSWTRDDRLAFSTRHTEARRKKLLILSERQNHRCCYCHRKCWHPAYGETGTNGTLATFEHFVPQYEGGTDNLNNGVMACHGCNVRRSTHDAFWFYEVMQMTTNVRNSRIQLEVNKYVDHEAKRATKVRREEKKSSRHATTIVNMAWLFVQLPIMSVWADLLMKEGEEFLSQNLVDKAA